MSEQLEERNQIKSLQDWIEMYEDTQEQSRKIDLSKLDESDKADFDAIEKRLSSMKKELGILNERVTSKKKYKQVLLLLDEFFAVIGSSYKEETLTTYQNYFSLIESGDYMDITERELNKKFNNLINKQVNEHLTKKIN